MNVTLQHVIRSHLYTHTHTRAAAIGTMPICLERIVQRELAARAKRAVVDAWRGLLQLRRRVERRGLSWLSFNGHLLLAIVRFWARNRYTLQV